jgi:hypothetical protein
VIESRIRSTQLTKEIITVRVEELQTVRLAFPKGVVHEMPLGELKQYAVALPDELTGLKQALETLADTLQFLARRDVTPSVEFVIPARQDAQ